VADAVIDNPILNSPFEEPGRHWKFERDGITNEIVEGRRVSSYFVPIPKSKRGDGQMQFQAEWTADRIEENRTINQVRERVALWRRGGHLGITPVTRKLLEYWTDSTRSRRLFFAQIEAVETAIYLGEVINKQAHQDAWITNFLREAAEDANPDLFRVALKMATGTGKTVVMGMLIVWQALNKAANKQDGRFADRFLIVSPGITIRDRLRVLLPESPDNYYRELDLVPPGEHDRLAQARIVITNYHGFLLRDRSGAPKTTKQVLAGREQRANPFQETPAQMAARVCRAFGVRQTRKGRAGSPIIVLNDEAHHCYRHRVGGDADDFKPGEARTAESKQEVKEREEQAAVWISGLEAINDAYGIKTVYDLSATPFFLAGSGYPEGKLFPWVVSDFALIDAIEAGLVKVPRVPVSDNTGADTPVFRNLWTHIRKALPKRGLRQQDLTDQRILPAQLEAALRSLYSNYEQSFAQWEAMEAEHRAGTTPPVFIVVCNNTSVSKLVYDWIAGWERPLGNDGQSRVVKGNLPLFSNADDDGQWTERPNSIVVDSAQLESGEAMSADFKKAAAVEIERFKDELRQRFPGRDADDLSDEDLMREVMNTVGKPDRLGEHIRCVVSVSMLTEGWDANTVTHILGVRAFGTQLLCEQVVGRGLRRRSHALDDNGRFQPEYAEVYGVPFSFIPAGGSDGPAPPPKYHRVRALEERAELAITFPRVRGYRHELEGQRLEAAFTEASRMTLSTADVPSETDVHPIVGEKTKHTLDDLRRRREQEVVFALAKRLLERYYVDQPWLFPQVARIAREWLACYVTLKDNTFIQMLLLAQHGERATENMQSAIVRADEGQRRLIAMLAPYERAGSSVDVDFDTSKKVMPTSPAKCHVSDVVADSGWEHTIAQRLEEMDEVRAYVKNDHLGFTVPYTHDGRPHDYHPDFIVRIDDGHGEDDPLNLIVEVSGQELDAKKAKCDTARTLWVPGVNNLDEFGRWAFIEITDPHWVQGAIREFIRGTKKEPVPA
jgi:type III restriction enzyme